MSTERATVRVVREAFTDTMRTLADAGHEVSGVTLEDRGGVYPYRYCVAYTGTPEDGAGRVFAYLTESWPGTYRTGREMLEFLRGVAVGATWGTRYDEARANDPRRVDR